LTRKEVMETIVDGFFPNVGADARPAQRARGGFTQLGLPYASDPAITRHLAAFLGRQAGAAAQLEAGRVPPTRRLLHPSAVLFNGGVLKAAHIRARLVETIDSWLVADGGSPVRVLPGADLDLAVAKGACAYALVRRGRGLRIRGGTARAYYVGIESTGPAVPGVAPSVSAMCVAPFGMEEGTEAMLPPHELGVVIGEPVTFRFFGSTVRRADLPGTMLDRWNSEELEELPPIELTLPADGRAQGEVVPVRLRSKVTEVGTLLLEAEPVRSKPDGASAGPAAARSKPDGASAGPAAARSKPEEDERWRIELNVRGQRGGPAG
jgi:hypothetical protein